MIQEHDHRKDRTVNVAINVHQPSGNKLQKLAVMWYPNNNNEDLNLISPKLVSEVLQIDVQRSDNTSVVQIDGNSLEIHGFVDLEWTVYAHGKRRQSKPTYRTRFKVTAQGDPPFDMLIGKKTAQECGLETQ